MSFALTTEQVRAGTKTVTRRFGWWFLKPGDLVQPVRKAMGLRKGETIEALRGPIRIVSVRKERLCDMTDDECVLEGFPHMTAHEFVDMLCDHYDCCSAKTVNRIEFEYTDNPKGESPAPEGRVGLDPLDVPRSAARQDGGAPFGMLPTRSVGNINKVSGPEPAAKGSHE